MAGLRKHKISADRLGLGVRASDAALARARNAQGQVKGPLSLGASRSTIRPRSREAAYRRKSIVGLVMGKDQTTQIYLLKSKVLGGDGGIRTLGTGFTSTTV
jgi:hypothetical protein